MIRSTSGALICCEIACCSVAEVAGMISPRPLSHAGSASSFHVFSPGGDCPVSAGMKRD